MGLKDTLKLYLRGLFGVHNSDTNLIEQQVGRMFRHSVVVELPADANAESNIAERAFWHANTGCQVKEVAFYPDSNVAAHGTNYAILQIRQAPGNGDASTVVANVATSSVSAVALRPYGLTIQSADVAAGQTLSLQALKAASGVDLPTGRFVVTLEEE